MDTGSDNVAILVALTSDIVVAHVSNNPVDVDDVPALIRSVHDALAGLGTTEVEPASLVPAVSIRASVKPDYIVCLEDGRKFKTLKRHLMTMHEMTPDDYRARWDLPSDYPIVSPNYAQKRREVAKSSGLGRKPGQRRGRPRKNV